MSRYRGPVSRLCRREGMKLYLKGAKCYTKKCPFERRATPPGQHGVRRRKMSEYGVQLREKQKMRRIYMVHERQFKRYFDTAESPSRRHRREPPAPARDAPRQRRLPDGLRQQPRQARQLVGHGHFAINGRATTSPRSTSRRVIASRSVRGSRKSSTSRSREGPSRVPSGPTGSIVDAHKLAGNVAAMPRRDQMPLELNEQLVVEYYSR